MLHHELQDGIYGLPGSGTDAQSYSHQGWVLCCSKPDLLDAAVPGACTCGRAAATTEPTVAQNTWYEVGEAITDYHSGSEHCSSNGLTLCCYDSYCPQGARLPLVLHC